MISVCKSHYHTSSDVQMILACPHLAGLGLVSSEGEKKQKNKKNQFWQSVVVTATSQRNWWLLKEPLESNARKTPFPGCIWSWCT